MLAEKDYLKESKLREAEKNLEDATKKKITKNKHLAFNRLGNLYHEQGDYTKAILNYKKALEAKKDFVVVYRNLYLIYIDKRDFDKAIEISIKGMKVLTDDKLFHGNMYFKQLHAWLHNGIGWTYLMKVIDANIDKNYIPLEKTEICSHERSDYLTKANHQFQEATKIFNDCISKCVKDKAKAIFNDCISKCEKDKENGKKDPASDIP